MLLVCGVGLRSYCRGGYAQWRKGDPGGRMSMWYVIVECRPNLITEGHQTLDTLYQPETGCEVESFSETLELVEIGRICYD